jgi:hypothetical protein
MCYRYAWLLCLCVELAQSLKSNDSLTTQTHTQDCSPHRLTLGWRHTITNDRHPPSLLPDETVVQKLHVSIDTCANALFLCFPLFNYLKSL